MTEQFKLELEKKITQLDGFIVKTKKNDTKVLFTALKRELETIHSEHDLDLAIERVARLIDKAKKKKTRTVFQVLKRELETIRKETLSQVALVSSVKKTPLKKVAKKKTTQTGRVPSPQHKITVKRKLRKTRSSQKVSDVVSMIKHKATKKSKFDHSKGKTLHVKKDGKEVKEGDLFESESAYDKTQETLKDVARKEGGSLLVKEDKKWWERIKDSFVRSYELYLLRRKSVEEARKMETHELQMARQHATSGVQSIFSLDYIKTLSKHLLKIQKNEALGEETPSDVGPSTLQLERIRRKSLITFSQERFFSELTEKEIKQHLQKDTKQDREMKIYEASLVGLYANQFCRQISFHLLKNFPDFFKKLYNALRLANIKVLSNTYVNIMVLSVIVGYAVFGILFLLIFLFRYPFFIAVPRALVMATLGGALAFGGLYMYPFAQLKERARSITTNLPFAITNMAAVASAGVPPTKMFKLIMESKEYGEFSTEIEKIVEYTELFGFDILTAIRSVASMTPSKKMREFFDGMLNTIESGGDINAYLEQKSTELMENYELERKKYTESVATYSDIYTGILIAAPLFFVSALSLVSLLGGSVGGMDVSVVIVIGTYLVIPLLNVAFLIFLTLTQPEV